jgi:iron-sulfur cluster repair protein YtfE (RIC family)
MTRKTTDAVELLKEDHEKVKQLFQQFESAAGIDQKEEIADQIDLELRVHSMIEEEILYPAFKDVDSELTAESFEEHGVVEELLNELATMDLEEEQFEAKFKVMQENVEHHIEEEETGMFPKCPQMPGYEALGSKMMQRKEQLMGQLEGKEDSERVTKGDPATMQASEKSEKVLSGESIAPPQRTRRAPSRRRSSRAKASSGRSRK